MNAIEQAHNIIRWCRTLATFTEEPGAITRTFLSPPMRQVHDQLSEWMVRLGMSVSIDAAGNLRGLFPSSTAVAKPRRLFIGSHLDTVPHAGAFDGILGVVMAVALVEQLHATPLPFAIEVVGFSEEEGVRFGAPFIGSRALIGALDDAMLDWTDTSGTRLRDAIAAYGLSPAHLDLARVGDDALGFLEFHIEQGPVLEHLKLPTAVVDTICGQNRSLVTFEGKANHAGTTPMDLRKDALAGAAEWIVAVEREAAATAGLVATVGRVDVEPGASNVIPGRCRATLDLRHADDRVRRGALERVMTHASAIASSRGLALIHESLLNQPAVKMDPSLISRLARATEDDGGRVHRLASGAGHDAMIMAARMPAAMLFVRSPGGLSHHPDETVLPEDVAAALVIGQRFIESLADE